MLDHMNKLGILSSVQTRRGSVHTLLCISAWIVDGKKYVNPHYVPINQRDYSGKSNIMTSTTAFPNKEDPPIKNGGTSPTQLAVNLHNANVVCPNLDQTTSFDIFIKRLRGEPNNLPGFQTFD